MSRLYNNSNPYKDRMLWLAIIHASHHQKLIKQTHSSITNVLTTKNLQI